MSHWFIHSQPAMNRDWGCMTREPSLQAVLYCCHKLYNKNGQHNAVKGLKNRSKQHKIKIIAYGFRDFHHSLVNKEHADANFGLGNLNKISQVNAKYLPNFLLPSQIPKTYSSRLHTPRFLDYVQNLIAFKFNRCGIKCVTEGQSTVFILVY
jgi:hypothetical protein